MYILLPHASAGLSCRSHASQWHSCSTESVMCCVWLHVCSLFNTQQSSPCLLLLVCLSVSFSCSRLIQIKLSFMFLSHSPSVLTQTPTQIQRQTYSTYAHATVLWASCQHRQRQHFYLLNVWKRNYFPVWICSCVQTCVCVLACTFVILTVRWVSEGHWKHLQQCQKSGSYSNHWGKERRGGGSCYVNLLELSDKWSWENTSAGVKARGQE